jgi:hypothetical protein
VSGFGTMGAYTYDGVGHGQQHAADRGGGKAVVSAARGTARGTAGSWPASAEWRPRHRDRRWCVRSRKK